MKVPYVQRVKLSDGRLALYFRKGGYREGPLAGLDGTQALRDEVEVILKRIERAEEAAKRPKAGTVGGMLQVYNSDPVSFLTLARSTQAHYQSIIDELVEDCGGVMLSAVTRAWVIDMRNAWAPRGYKAANDRLQVLKNALAPVIDDDADDRIAGDPFHKVKKVPPPHGAGETNPAWEDYEVEIAIADALERGLPGLARAIALGRWGGFRKGTICAIPLGARVQGFSDAGDSEHRLHWITEKRKVLCDKREDPRLTAILGQTPNRAITIAYNADGRAWKPRQLSQAVDRHLARLAKQGRVRTMSDEEGNTWSPLTLHGLRHARGVEIALGGGSDAEIMAQLEHATDRAAKIYRRQADRRKLADAAQDRVDNVVKLRAAKARQNGA